MSNEATTPLQACLAETIASQHPVLKITRLFSTGQYEHVKYEVEIPLPNGGMGQALLDVDNALYLLNPAKMPHNEEDQKEYLAMLGTDSFTAWHATQIESYEQWKRDEQRGKEILDAYTKPQPYFTGQQENVNQVDPSNESNPPEATEQPTTTDAQ